jgi:hypothetical protein
MSDDETTILPVLAFIDRAFIPSDGETSLLQCAGLNRHEAENAKFLRERTSDLLGPENISAGRTG